MRRPEHLKNSNQFRRTCGVICAVLLLTGVLTRLSLAQPPSALPASCQPAQGICPPVPQMPPGGDAIWNPACPRANGGFSAHLPKTPESPPRPAEGPRSIAAFVDGLNRNDAVIEVLVGQGRILTTKAELAVRGQPTALVAVADPTVIDFAIINSRQIRLTSRRMGVTDLTIITPDNQTYTFEVRVVADLHVLDAQLRCLFPDASLKLTQVRDYVVVEGEARDAAQVARIMETIRAYLASILTAQLQKITQTTYGPQQPQTPPRSDGQPAPVEPGASAPPLVALPELLGNRNIQATAGTPRVINLIRVPGSKQVMLKVKVAELNRTAFRQIGADFLFVNQKNGVAAGSLIGNSSTAVDAKFASRTLAGMVESMLSSSTTVFGIFEKGDFAFFLSALRRNNMLRILAEPNLVALNGHAATFLAGGEFPVPVAQSGAGVGAAPTITVQFKEFGVKLGFVPTILDGDVIRLAVDPEVSTIDFAIGSVLVAGGTVTPGLNTRKAHTVVEMHEGQTLAMAGLLQLTMDGRTDRIPGLGDLPFIGPFFSNTTGQRIEKELIVMVTPYLVEPMNPDQVPPAPGDEVKTPTDLEFYLLNRIEGKKTDWRATTQYDWQFPLLKCLFKMDSEHVCGPHGYCDN